MPAKIVPGHFSKSSEYLEFCLRTNPDYNDNDIKWTLDIYLKHYDSLTKDSKKYYTAITLINRKSFSGYFSQLYNYLLVKNIQSKNESKLIELLLNPEFTEMHRSKLTDSELEEVNNIMYMETLITNIVTLKYNLNSESFGYNEIFISKLFQDVYNETYLKLFSGTLPSRRSTFDDFLILTQYDTKTRSNRAYTYQLLEILIKIVMNNKDFFSSDKILNNLMEKYGTEVKLVEYSVSRLKYEISDSNSNKAS